MEEKSTEIQDFISGLYGFFKGEEGSDWNKRKIKKFIKSNDLAKIPYSQKRKFYNMFDPGQKISSEYIAKQIEIYFDLLAEGFDFQKFPVIEEFVEELYSQDITSLVYSRLDALMKPLKKIEYERLPEQIKMFVDSIPKLYTQNVDKLTNKQISLLIDNIREMQFGDLPREMQVFVIEMFKRCAVKTQTSDNNNNIFSTSSWFKDEIQNYYGQLNKAFMGVSLYTSILNEPTKKLNFKNLINYANLQDALIEELQDLSDDYNLDVCDILRRKESDYIFRLCNELSNKLNLPELPEYDPSSYYFLNNYTKEPREYKTSITKKLAPMFESMINYKLAEGANTKNLAMFFNNLEGLVVTKKREEEFDRMTAYLSMGANSTDESIYRETGDWLCELVHLNGFLNKNKKDMIQVPDSVKFNIAFSPLNLESTALSNDKTVVYEEMQNLLSEINEKGVAASSDLVDRYMELESRYKELVEDESMADEAAEKQRNQD